MTDEQCFVVLNYLPAVYLNQIRVLSLATYGCPDCNCTHHPNCCDEKHLNAGFLTSEHWQRPDSRRDVKEYLRETVMVQSPDSHQSRNGDRRLYLIRAYRRSYFGESQVTEPSRFLEDIPLHLVSNQGAASAHSSGSPRSSVSRRSSWGDEYNQDTRTSRETGRVFGSGKPQASSSKPQSTARPSSNTTPIAPKILPSQKNNPEGAPQTSAKPKSQQYKPGERVRHDKFGEGIILRSEMEQNTEFVEVQFQGKHGKKRLSLDFAKLEKI